MNQGTRKNRGRRFAEVNDDRTFPKEDGSGTKVRLRNRLSLPAERILETLGDDSDEEFRPSVCMVNRNNLERILEIFLR